MKRTMAMLVFFASLCLTGTSAFAENNPMKGLTEEQAAQIQLQIAQMKGADAVPVVEKADQWASVAERLSNATSTLIVKTAKDLGVTANEFATTRVGVLVVALLVWHFIGNSIIHIIAGTIWFTVALPAWMYYFRRMCLISEIEYNENGKKKSVSYQDASDAICNTRWAMAFILAVVLGIGLITTFTY